MNARFFSILILFGAFFFSSHLRECWAQDPSAVVSMLEIDDEDFPRSSFRSHEGAPSNLSKVKLDKWPFALKVRLARNLGRLSAALATAGPLAREIVELIEADKEEDAEAKAQRLGELNFMNSDGVEELRQGAKRIKAISVGALEVPAELQVSTELCNEDLAEAKRRFALFGHLLRGNVTYLREADTELKQIEKLSDVTAVGLTQFSEALMEIATSGAATIFAELIGLQALEIQEMATEANALRAEAQRKQETIVKVLKVEQRRFENYAGNMREVFGIQLPEVKKEEGRE